MKTIWLIAFLIFPAASFAQHMWASPPPPQRDYTGPEFVPPFAIQQGANGTKIVNMRRDTVLLNSQQIHFDGAVKPITIEFCPANQVYVTISNFYYNAADFYSTVSGSGNCVASRRNFVFPVYPISMITNFNAQGSAAAIFLTFDCHKPQPTNSVPQPAVTVVAHPGISIDHYGVPEPVYNQIIVEAQKHWPTDFEMQEFEIKNQIAAYRRLHQ